MAAAVGRTPDSPIAIVIGYIAATEGAKVRFYGRKSKWTRRFRHG
jgi:hypothetical protein